MMSAAAAPQSWPLTKLCFISGRNAGKVRCERDWHWKMPIMRDYDLWFVAKGSGTIEVNGTAYSIEPGTCFLLRPGDSISARHDPEDRLLVYFVHFMSRAAKGIELSADPLADWPTRVHLSDAIWLEQLLGRLVMLNDDMRDTDDAAEFDALVRAALHVLARESSERARKGRLPPPVRTVIRTIREHIASPPSRAELARIAGLSERYLNVLMKRHTGMSLKTFTAKARIERACRLLEESAMSVGQIAEALSYNDIYFFSRQFKQYMGVSPTAYRHRATADFIRGSASAGRPQRPKKDARGEEDGDQA